MAAHVGCGGSDPKHEEAHMLRLTAAALALAALASPAMSQTGAPSGSGQMTVPSAQNSGAGIPGQPGNKSGPPARSPSATTGAAPAQTPTDDATRQQDAAKIPGQPGNKS